MSTVHDKPLTESMIETLTWLKKGNLHVKDLDGRTKRGLQIRGLIRVLKNQTVKITAAGRRALEA